MTDGAGSGDNAIDVTGGTTVEITVDATINAKDEAASGDITNGDIAVTGDGNTTDVSITQNASVTPFVTPAVEGTMATQEVTFKALAEGETTTLGSLTFTAAKALTAAEVAQAFADLTNSDRQDAGGPTANGIYSGTFSSAWASQSIDGDKVTFGSPGSHGVMLPYKSAT